MDPISVTFGQKCNFRAPKLVTFYYYELTHFLNWMKNTLLFIYSTNILERLLTVSMKNCLTPKIKQMRNPVTVTLDNATPLKSIRSWNATPSSGTFPLASKKNRGSTKIAYKFSAPNVPISRRNKATNSNTSTDLFSTAKKTLSSMEENCSFFSLAESPPRDLQITAYK